MSQVKRTAQTIKVKGRKYVVIQTSIARVNHKNVYLRLLKRAGKPHFFVMEGELEVLPVRYKDFWAGLQAYSDRQDALGIDSHKDREALVIPTDVYVAMSHKDIRNELKTATVSREVPSAEA